MKDAAKRLIVAISGVRRGGLPIKVGNDTVGAVGTLFVTNFKEFDYR